jgi:hypothetical protein
VNWFQMRGFGPSFGGGSRSGASVVHLCEAKEGRGELGWVVFQLWKFNVNRLMRVHRVGPGPWFSLPCWLGGLGGVMLIVRSLYTRLFKNLTGVD